jgi:ribosomal protein S18 acetylase RimI-like enzyme
VLVRPRGDADSPAVRTFLTENHSLRVARRGVLLHPMEHPALIAVDGDRLAGVLTYVVDGASCEILTLHAGAQWHGIGSALLAEVARVAAAAGCTRLWLVTTNDNVDALRFYQRRDFRLTALRPGAVDAGRATLKPEVPLTGAYGIHLRDELELTKPLPDR